MIFLFIIYYAGGQVGFIQPKQKHTTANKSQNMRHVIIRFFIPVEFTLVSDWWDEIEPLFESEKEYICAWFCVGKSVFIVLEFSGTKLNSDSKWERREFSNY